MVSWKVLQYMHIQTGNTNNMILFIVVNDRGDFIPYLSNKRDYCLCFIYKVGTDGSRQPVELNWWWNDYDKYLLPGGKETPAVTDSAIKRKSKWEMRWKKKGQNRTFYLSYFCLKIILKYTKNPFHCYTNSSLILIQWLRKKTESLQFYFHAALQQKQYFSSTIGWKKP